jgi:segregation and condensation protein A
MAKRSKPAKTDDPGATALGFVAPPDIHIECDAFKGSLAMLFQMVKDRKIDLLGVPLAPICKAYFQHVLETSAQHDLESAATAMTALAYLLERKAWQLLPKPDEEPDEEDLLDDLDPYIQEFRPAIDELSKLKDERNQIFFRSGDSGGDYELPFEIGEAQASDLASVLERLLERAKPDTVDPPTGPRRSLSEQMIIVMNALDDEPRPIEEVVTEEFTRSEVVWWFLALLELIRLGQARVLKRKAGILFARGESGS